MKLNEKIKRLLRESSDGDNSEYEEAPDKEKDVDLTSKHKRVKSLLDNPVFNHAGIIERLWGDSEATNRSLFRKKLNMELNDNDTPYTFDDEDLSKIISILMDTSKKINKGLNKRS